MQHFNGLTPAEAERLALLMEEMGEAQQIIGKILRHGFDSYNPFDEDNMTNRSLLTEELGHVHHAIMRLCEANDINKATLHMEADQKAARVGRWLHHQG